VEQATGAAQTLEMHLSLYLCPQQTERQPVAHILMSVLKNKYIMAMTLYLELANSAVRTDRGVGPSVASFGPHLLELTQINISNVLLVDVSARCALTMNEGGISAPRCGRSNHWQPKLWRYVSTRLGMPGRLAEQEHWFCLPQHLLHAKYSLKSSSRRVFIFSSRLC
jgi:hypothetical protein